MANIERTGLGLANNSELLRSLGFSPPSAATAERAVRLGARRVIAFHGAAPDVLQTSYKAADGDTPVTVADRLSGDAMKRYISRRYPSHGINEEESADTEGTSLFKWHIDPLDGTSSFGLEQRYSTVADCLYYENSPVVAAICHPFDRVLYLAERGKGAFELPLTEKMVIDPEQFNRKTKQLHVSHKKLSQKGVVYVDALFNAKTAPRKIRLLEDMREMSGDNLGVRMTGSNIDQQRHVAAGHAEVTLTDAVGGFFDLAAGGLLIQEAGGIFTDVFGNPVDRSTQVAIGSNGHDHAEILEKAQEAYLGYNGFR